MDLVTPFMTGTNIGIILASSGLLAAIRAWMPTVDKNRWWARVQPIAPLVLCVGLVFLPTSAVVGRWGDKLILGLALGAISTVAYKTFRQTLRGQDERIKQTAPPAVEP